MESKSIPEKDIKRSNMESPQLTTSSVKQELVSHCVNCTDAKCEKKICADLKKLLLHGQVCHVRVSGSCSQCLMYWKILSEHAQKCTDEDCNVPHCGNLRPTSLRLSLIRRGIHIFRKHSPLRYKDLENEQKEDDLEDDLYDARPTSTRVMGCLVTETADCHPEFVADNPLFGK